MQGYRQQTLKLTHHPLEDVRLPDSQQSTNGKEEQNRSLCLCFFYASNNRCVFNNKWQEFIIEYTLWLLFYTRGCWITFFFLFNYDDDENTSYLSFRQLLSESVCLLSWYDSTNKRITVPTTMIEGCRHGLWRLPDRRL